MQITKTDTKVILQAIARLKPNAEQSTREWNAIRQLKLFAKKYKKNGQ